MKSKFDLDLWLFDPNQHMPSGMVNTCVKYHYCKSKGKGSYRAETSFPQTVGQKDRWIDSHGETTLRNVSMVNHALGQTRFNLGSSTVIKFLYMVLWWRPWWNMVHHAGLLLTMVLHFDHGNYDNLLVHHGNLVWKLAQRLWDIHKESGFTPVFQCYKQKDGYI